ncbi:unnamed protein product [Ilex paraguariensis]|uniref:CASP-like protein n=1 Tax=Ilex paraguariensis TaxID=185542 RepID=A0ABC8R1E2_9AQUA
MQDPNQDINTKNVDSIHKTGNRSMSDTESQTSQFDSFHSPLHSDSSLHSDYPEPLPPPAPDSYSPPKSPSKAIVSADKLYPPLRSPEKPPQNSKFQANSNLPPSYPPAVKSQNQAPLVKSQNQVPPGLVVNKAVREEVASGVTKVGHTGLGGVEDGYGGGAEDGVGGERRSRAAVSSILRRTRKDVMVNKAALGFRVCEVILCLISFSVMAADKTQGWSGDSFDRYKEYRYCVAVSVIGFAYSGFQACNLSYHLISGKYIISHPLRYYFDFAMDQILAYLLMSASSSAAARVDDWTSNWGKDEFTEMASASIGMSFLAFVAFATSSLISGYNLCNFNST